MGHSHDTHALWTDANFLRKVAAQLQEMDLVRTKIYQLEQAQIAMKTKYVVA